MTNDRNKPETAAPVLADATPLAPPAPPVPPAPPAPPAPVVKPAAAPIAKSKPAEEPAPLPPPPVKAEFDPRCAEQRRHFPMCGCKGDARKPFA